MRRNHVGAERRTCRVHRAVHDGLFCPNGDGGGGLVAGRDRVGLQGDIVFVCFQVKEERGDCGTY